MAGQTLVRAVSARGRPRRSAALPKTCGPQMDAYRAALPHYPTTAPPHRTCARGGRDEARPSRRPAGRRWPPIAPHYRTTQLPHHRTARARGGGRDEARPSRSRLSVCSFIRWIVGRQPSNHQTIKPSNRNGRPRQRPQPRCRQAAQTSPPQVAQPRRLRRPERAVLKILRLKFDFEKFFSSAGFEPQKSPILGKVLFFYSFWLLVHFFNNAIVYNILFNFRTLMFSKRLLLE